MFYKFTLRWNDSALSFFLKRGYLAQEFLDKKTKVAFQVSGLSGPTKARDIVELWWENVRRALDLSILKNDQNQVFFPDK